MRQVLYGSVIANAATKLDLEALVVQARSRNKALCATGIIWSDGWRIVQVIEGPDTAIERLFTSIQNDTRHKIINTILYKSIVERQFGIWPLAYRTANNISDGYDAKAYEYIMASSYDVRRLFIRQIPYPGKIHMELPFDRYTYR